MASLCLTPVALHAPHGQAGHGPGRRSGADWLLQRERLKWVMACECQQLPLSPTCDPAQSPQKCYICCPPRTGLPAPQDVQLCSPPTKGVPECGACQVPCAAVSLLLCLRSDKHLFFGWQLMYSGGLWRIIGGKWQAMDQRGVPPFLLVLPLSAALSSSCEAGQSLWSVVRRSPVVSHLCSTRPRRLSEEEHQSKAAPFDGSPLSTFACVVRTEGQVLVRAIERVSTHCLHWPWHLTAKMG
jgi:hypothetical protein